ncbi:hypothetical protein [Streptomyces lasiicapitis]|uniref:hypothetical protein n=1 Tax=Streptomyces lasiicapitis TaxID=1923961 RepID=UPI00364F23D2
MTRYASLAEALQTAAEAMRGDLTLDADRALRLAIWDNADAPTAGDGEPGADLYAAAIASIAQRCNVSVDEVVALPHGRAQMAARIEASRYRSYG